MCWSASVSLATYAFGVLAAASSYAVSGRLPNLLYLNFVHMQLLEYFMWSDQSCAGLNQLANRAGLVLVTLQPLCSVLSRTPYLSLPSPSDMPARLLPAASALFSKDSLRVYVGVTVAALLRHAMLAPGHDWCSTPGQDGHLCWEWVATGYDGVHYAVASAYYAMCFAPLAASGQHLTASLFLGTWLYSVYRRSATGGWASLWCFLVNARAVGYLGGV